MKYILMVSSLLIFFQPRIGFSDALLNKQQRVLLIQKLSSEMTRLDGDGLIPRNTRPESWKTTIGRLKTEAANSRNPIQLGLVLKRLDATYPNLHAKVTLAKEFDGTKLEGRLHLGARFASESIDERPEKVEYKISSINSDLFASVAKSDRPVLGDELLSINHKSMDHWAQQNFIFCKHPLKMQCEASFYNNFRMELLGWSRSKPLIYKVKRANRTWEVNVPIIAQLSGQNGDVRTESNSQPSLPGCNFEPARYPGFKEVYVGYNVCALESDQYKETVLLRIKSFTYRNVADGLKIKKITDETAAFWDQYWSKKASSKRHLIIDLIDNGGGDAPIEWYKLIYQKPFQEQYVSFKKIPEIEREDIKKEIFYNEPGRAIWFEDIKRSGVYRKTSIGHFLPHHPDFCVFEDKNCNEGEYQPKGHGFAGDIKLLVDEWCISSCVGFVWSLKDQLGPRVKIFGFPDSGDTAFARVFIDVRLNAKSKDGFDLLVTARLPNTLQAIDENLLARQSVSITQTTDKDGKVISGVPTHVDQLVARTYKRDATPWETRVLDAALSDIKASADK